MPLAITPTFRPRTHTSDDSYIYQLSLVVATATVSYGYPTEILSPAIVMCAASSMTSSTDDTMDHAMASAMDDTMDGAMASSMGDSMAWFMVDAIASFLHDTAMASTMDLSLIHI